MDIEFRPATADDLELMLAWRSHPSLYEQFYQQEGPLNWETHVEWWESRENRRDWIITIREDDRWRDVGSVYITDLDAAVPEVGVYVGEVTAWGSGIATQAVEFAVDWLAANGCADARARILYDNEGSQRVFEKAGFEFAGDARSGESEYRITID